MNKFDWVRKIGTLIRSDHSSGVDFIFYKENKNELGWRREVIEVHYHNEQVVKINITGNSLGAILHEIVREVYGYGAIGRIYDEY